jgi:hypothetical protein
VQYPGPSMIPESIGIAHVAPQRVDGPVPAQSEGLPRHHPARFGHRGHRVVEVDQRAIRWRGRPRGCGFIGDKSTTVRCSRGRCAEGDAAHSEKEAVSPRRHSLQKANAVKLAGV